LSPIKSGVERDSELLNLYVDEFEEKWNTIKDILGPVK
jgi:hypothetical protein